jgi:hypothetical protein
LAEYLREIWRVVNKMPNISAFSGTTPNSALSGVPGDLAVSIAVDSNDSRLFVKGGASRTPSTTGWVTVRIT